MPLHFAYALVLVFGTTVIHAACTVAILQTIRAMERHRYGLKTAWTRIAVLAALVFLMSVAGYLESGLWACFYLMVGALSSFSDAIYFSLVTFTTVGYGDITLGKEWRILAALEAANGIIMFGWTTAIIVAVAHRLFFRAADDEGAPR